MEPEGSPASSSRPECDCGRTPGRGWSRRGTVLVGGSPVRVLRLTPAGARAVAGWFSGVPVAGSAAARTLARRLLDAGIAHPDWGAAEGSDGSPGVADVTVVIPVRDRYAELGRCLAGLRGLPHVIVVDDCSADPEAIAAICAEHGARVVRRPVNGGPGAARNTGLAVAVDRLGRVPRLRLRAAAGLAGPAAAALRRSGRRRGRAADRAARGRNDLAGPVRGREFHARHGSAGRASSGPGARVSYVPGAALVVRKAAAGAGFAAGMYVGEDVDFVWRMAAAGWRVRYEPRRSWATITASGSAPGSPAARDYGTSAAALEQLHPGVGPPAVRLLVDGRRVGGGAVRPAGHRGAHCAATALLARRLSRVTGERWPLPAASGRA